MANLVEVLLAVVIGFTPTAETPKSQAFTPYRNYPGEYRLNIDEESIRISGDDTTPLVLVDIQIIMEKPVKYIDSPILVKSYQNSVAVDCRNDRVLVVVGRAFSIRGSMIYSTSKPEIVNNNHEIGTPTTALIELFCPPILERYKETRPRINTLV